MRERERQRIDRDRDIKREDNNMDDFLGFLVVIVSAVAAIYANKKKKEGIKSNWNFSVSKSSRKNLNSKSRKLRPRRKLQ